MLLKILEKIDDLVWGVPTIILILATGLLLTIRCRGIQFTKTGRAFKQIFKKNDAEGELSGFSALCTALSATIGTGNIVGVATAVLGGGPGALFWMWIAAILGTATKYSECMLAIKYREVKPDGHILGGPFYTIEKGMKERTGWSWKWLAIIFAVFGVLAGLLGIGTMTQVNGITDAVNGVFDPNSTNVAFTIGERAYTWSTVIAGALVTIFAALVIIGGLKRISKVAEKVVPSMAFIYVFLGISVIIMNATKIPAAFVLIFKSAFGFSAVTAGVAGYIIKMILDSMRKGIARGIFSNEAGLGSAPIAAAPVQTNEPVEQGLVNMTGTIIDTLIICTMTGLAIVLAFYGDIIAPGGMVYEMKDNVLTLVPKWNGGLEGSQLTAAAFSRVLGGDNKSVKFLLMVCLAFFAFTTILGWDYYSEKCLEYLTNGKMKLVLIFRILFIIVVAIGPYFKVEEVFKIADITNGLMAIPNCISLIFLSGVVARETQKYFEKFPKL